MHPVGAKYIFSSAFEFVHNTTQWYSFRILRRTRRRNYAMFCYSVENCEMRAHVKRIVYAYELNWMGIHSAEIFCTENYTDCISGRFLTVEYTQICFKFEWFWMEISRVYLAKIFQWDRNTWTIYRQCDRLLRNKYVCWSLEWKLDECRINTGNKIIYVCKRTEDSTVVWMCVKCVEQDQITYILVCLQAPTPFQTTGHVIFVHYRI